MNAKPKRISSGKRARSALVTLGLSLGCSSFTLDPVRARTRGDSEGSATQSAHAASPGELDGGQAADGGDRQGAELTPGAGFSPPPGNEPTPDAEVTPPTGTEEPPGDASTSNDMFESCSDPSDCVSPPEDECADDVSLTRFASTGSCTDGRCEYAQEPERCEYGCDEGKCQTDPCEGQPCDDPPDNSCEDGQLRAYDPQGTCTDGECEYTSHTISCECSSSTSCETDPCESVSCDEPLDADCDGTTYVTYASSGTCIAGSCSYEKTEKSCYACREDGCYCPAGTKVMDGSCSECGDGEYSAEVDSAECTPRRDCGPGFYVTNPRSRTADRQCAECPPGTFSDGVNSEQCRQHTTCTSPNIESEPPTASQDRECDCPQLCEGRCIAADRCCAAAPHTEPYINETLDTTKTYEFCLEESARVQLSAAIHGGGPNAQPPSVEAILEDANGTRLGSATPSLPATVDVSPGTYSVTLKVGPGTNAGGEATAVIGPPP